MKTWNVAHRTDGPQPAPGREGIPRSPYFRYTSPLPGVLNSHPPARLGRHGDDFRSVTF